MKSRFKIFAVLLAFVILFAACGNDYGEEVPEYETDEEFYIGMWIGVPNSIKTYDEETGELISEGRALTEEEFDNHYRLIKEAGFNYVDPGYGEYSESYNRRALEAAEKWGLKQYINDFSINELLMNDLLDEEEVESRLQNLAQKYKGYSSFAGLKIKDEPTFTQISQYVTAKQRFDKVFGTDKIFYINLLPVIAGVDRVSNSYSEYIKKYVREIGTHYVSYDHYPLKNDARGNNYVLENFLYNMMLVKNAAPDRDIWTFLQSIKYGNSNRELTSVADATFQVYSFLAFGGKGIQWFCYWSPPYNDGATIFGYGCIDRSGNKTATYDYVKAANLEVRGLEKIYLNFEWKNVMTIIGTENDDGGENRNFNYIQEAAISSHDRIESVRTQQDTLIGVFKDGEGRDGFMVVNFTEPSKNLDNKVELKFKNCTRALVVKNGREEVIDCKNGQLTFTQKAGEGYFVIPLK